MSNGLEIRYFILKPKGDIAYAIASRAAMVTFAEYIRNENSDLANNWVDKEVNE